MSCPASNSCKWGIVIASCFLGAIGIQIFIALIATAVAIGNGYQMWFAVMHSFTWPIFFLSLFLSVIMTIKCLLKKCCHQRHHSEAKSEICCKQTEKVSEDASEKTLL